MGRVSQFSTRDISPGERLGYWREATLDVYGRLAIEVRDPTNFEGEMSTLALPNCELTSTRSSEAVLSWSGSDGDPAFASYGLQVQQSGQSTYITPAGEFSISRGDLILVDLARPYEVRHESGTQALIFRAPKREFRAHGLDPGKLAGISISAQKDRAAILARFLTSSWQSLRQDDFPAAWNDGLSGATWSLMSVLFAGDHVQSTPSRYADIRRRVKDRLVTSHNDPDFSIGALARAIGVSERKLQLAFAETGQTPSTYILDFRLDMAARLLASTDGSVSAIALDAGFNDLSYFFRRFRNRFGQTPKAYREHRLGAVS